MVYHTVAILLSEPKFDLSIEQMNLTKRVGLVKGLKATFGFMPFLYLFMLNLLTSMSIAVSKFRHGNVILVRGGRGGSKCIMALYTCMAW